MSKDMPCPEVCLRLVKANLEERRIRSHLDPPPGIAQLVIYSGMNKNDRRELKGKPMSKQDEQRLLVKIATLYNENKKQSEIASLLNLSQSFVSRADALSKEGLVKITVVQPTNIFVSLEKAIEQQYGIRQAIVVDVGKTPAMRR
jgi:hypothetical protein